MSMNISFIITIDPCAIRNSGGPALLKPQNYATTTKGQRSHGHTNKQALPTCTLIIQTETMCIWSDLTLDSSCC